MADTLALGASAARHGGSSPLPGTTLLWRGGVAFFIKSVTRTWSPIEIFYEFCEIKYPIADTGSVRTKCPLLGTKLAKFKSIFRAWHILYICARIAVERKRPLSGPLSTTAGLPAKLQQKKKKHEYKMVKIGLERIFGMCHILDTVTLPYHHRDACHH